MSLDEAVKVIDDGLAHARKAGVRKLLVDIRELDGFDPPSIGSRFWLIRKWAATVSGAFRIAMVARPEMIDPHKFGVTVARNRGLICQIFPSVPKAAAWLAVPGRW